MSTAAQSAQETTIANLLTAYNGESNACARYGAFAARAEAEGFFQVASLFRATSRAEQIHAYKQANVIRSLGGKSVLTLEMPEVKTTAENLKVAIAGEEYEFQTMYPEFVKQAEATNADITVMRALKGAMLTEVEHAKLYKAALAGLKPAAAKATYYVCPVCGYTADHLGFDNCPICKVLKEKFEAIQ
jgi:rubrerythrin